MLDIWRLCPPGSIAAQQISEDTFKRQVFTIPTLLPSNVVNVPPFNGGGPLQDITNINRNENEPETGPKRSLHRTDANK